MLNLPSLRKTPNLHAPFCELLTLSLDKFIAVSFRQDSARIGRVSSLLCFIAKGVRRTGFHILRSLSVCVQTRRRLHPNQSATSGNHDDGKGQARLADNEADDSIDIDDVRRQRRNRRRQLRRRRRRLIRRTRDCSVGGAVDREQ